VETLKPGLKLKQIDHTPPFLAVQLKEEKATLEGIRYRMTVTVPKNQAICRRIAPLSWKPSIIRLGRYGSLLSAPLQFRYINLP